MGAQPAVQVQSSLHVLRGTPVEVYSKSQGRWIAAVIGGPKDVREPPPAPTAILVLFKEIVGGRDDAYKWIRYEDVPKFIRARPEAKRQAGMMDSMASENFGTMFENRSAFDKRAAAPTKQVAPMASMPSIPPEQPHEQPPSGVMATLMSSLNFGQASQGSFAIGQGSQASLPASAMGSFNLGQAPQGSFAIGQGSLPSSAMGSFNIGQAPQGSFSIGNVGMAPSAVGSFNMDRCASMASTIDQNSSRLMKRPASHPMGSMASTTIHEEEEQPGLFSSMMGSFNMGPAPQQSHTNVMSSMPPPPPRPQGHGQGQGYSHGHAAPRGNSQGHAAPRGNSAGHSGHAGQQGGLMSTMMASNNGSMASCPSMVAYTENTSPNRTPMGSTNGKVQAHPMAGFMNSMGFAT